MSKRGDGEASVAEFGATERELRLYHRVIIGRSRRRRSRARDERPLQRGRTRRWFDHVSGDVSASFGEPARHPWRRYLLLQLLHASGYAFRERPDRDLGACGGPATGLATAAPR